MTSAAKRLPLCERYGTDLARLTAAVAADSDQDFLDALDELVSLRRRELFGRLRRLTAKLQAALDRFNLDSRFAQLAEREVPDARARLAHVLKLTDEAAHRTMDLVDQSVPLAAHTGDGAEALCVELAVFTEDGSLQEALPGLLEKVSSYLVTTRREATQLKHNLNEVVMTQTFQDLSGQIIRSVIALVLQLETTLAELLAIAGAEGGLTRTAAARAASPAPPRASAAGDEGSRDAADEAAPKGSSYGPVVPGVTRDPVVAGQSDVDDLLSGLGL